MEKLTLCSKVLYDKEILDAQKELFTYKNKYETPRKEFQNWEEYEEQLKMMYLKIGTKLEELLCNNSQHYVFWDPDTINTDGVLDTVRECLTKLTNNPIWSEHHSNEIIFNVHGMLESLSDTVGLFTNSSPITPEQLVDIILNLIKWHISESSTDCLLTSFPQIWDDDA